MDQTGPYYTKQNNIILSSKYKAKDMKGKKIK